MNSASNFGKLGDPPSNPELLEHLATLVRRERPVDQEAPAADDAERRLPVERRRLPGGVREGLRQPLVLARQPPPHDRRGSARLGAVRRRRARREDGRPVRGADAVGDAAHALREGSAATSSTRSCSCSTFPAPTISAEQRFSTNVPLQRLFLMNSDFMQQQAEKLARTLRAGSRQRRAHQEGLPHALRPRAEGRGADRRPRVPRRRTAARLRRAQGGRREEDRARRQEEAKKPAAKKDDKPKMGEGMMAGRDGAWRRRRQGQEGDAAGDAAGPLSEGAAEFVGVPLRRLRRADGSPKSRPKSNGQLRSLDCEA